MAFNGSGTWNKPTGQPVVSGSTISSTTHNTLVADLQTALSTCILKDGQQTITANIPFNGNKITGLGSGTSNGDAVAVGDNVSGLNNDAGYVTSVTTVLSKSSDYTLQSGDLDEVLYVFIDASSADVAITELALGSMSGTVRYVVDTDTAGNQAQVKNSGGTVIWIGAKPGDFFEAYYDGTSRLVTGHDESIYLRIYVNADESVAQGASEKITSLTAATDTAGLWDSANDELDIPSNMDALMDLHWMIMQQTGRILGATAKIGGSYILDFGAAQSTTNSTAAQQTLSVTAVEVSGGDDVELWAYNTNTDSGSQTVLGDAAGDESQATFRIRWRY